MSSVVFRSANTPIRKDPSWEEKWKGPDNGLIICWEVGRELRDTDPELADKASRGELPLMGWKGGVTKKLKMKKKYGSLRYLAQWLGIRGEDLNIDPNIEHTYVCTKTNMTIDFTSDSSKYAEP